MKKILSICGIGIFLISMLGACSLFGGNKEPNNGLLLLGEEQALKAVGKKHKKEIKSAIFYKAKQAESGGKQVFMLNEQTAQKIVKRGILREKDDDGYMSTSTPVSSLPKIKDKKALVFADPKHKDIQNMEVNGMMIQTKYESNSIIGGFPRGKKSEELLLVVDNATFQKIPSPEIDMSVMELNKTYGENKSVNTKDIEAVQAQNELIKLIESIQGDVTSVTPISILK
ncbi:lipoprotein BA_5634 family protein [Bacillus cereus]|uniref:lipoprotein BA_5634 family protein n=1 Tax=Bacillus cereus TaxID=1396 RepID=UPI0032F7EB8F|nr:hypothetical protein [Bacillus cereus]HDR7713913.1 hypothetical protein [Bacillus cereus]